jgi:O-antigen ligase
MQTEGMPDPLGSRSSRRPQPTPSRFQSIYEWAALALCALPAVLGPWLFGAVRIWSAAPLIVGVMVAAVLTLLRPLFFPDTAPIRRPPAWPAFILFVLYAAIRAPFAAVPYDAWFEVLRLSSYAAAWWVWTQLAAQHGRWRVILAGVLLSATFMAWYALVQHSQGSRMVLNVVRPVVYQMRASGAYICPNHFASLLEIVAAAGLAMACCGSAGALLRMLGGYTVLISLPPLFLTQSRSGWIAMAVGLFVAAFLSAARRGTRMLAVVVVVAPLLAGGGGWLAWKYSPMVQARVAEALEGNVRLALWRDTLQMVKDSPWWGHGPGSYRWVYPSFKRHMTAYLDPQFAHNDLLHTVAEHGAVGLALLGAALGLALLPVLRVRRRESDRAAALVTAFAAAMLASLAHAMFDYNLQIYANAQALVLLAGLMAAALCATGESPSWHPPRALNAGLRAVAVVLALVVCVAALRALRSDLATRAGDAARNELDYDAARSSYKKAIRAAPGNWRAHLGMGHLVRVQASWNRDREARVLQIDEAHRHYVATLERNPWQTEAMHGQSKLYAMAGDPHRSREELERLVARVPYHRFYLTELGLRLREMGLYREALDRFMEAHRVENTEMIDLNIQWLQEKLAAEAAGAGQPEP